MVFLRRNRITIKIGVPKNPVTAERGISDAVNVLEIMSQIIANAAPNKIVSGMVFRASRPTQMRAIWGTTKPIHPTIPLYATDAAVSSVAVRIIRLR